MNSKKFLNSLLVVFFIVLAFGVVKYFLNNIYSNDLFLSLDKKSIVANDKVLLAIDNDTIFNWFQTESQLCDVYNIASVSDREKFCKDQSFFREQTRFSSIVVSPDKDKIGFTIESDTLSPDKVVGIFLSFNNRVVLLTNYYLGNEFISFSPNGKNFVYKGGCFEGMCGLFVNDSETLINKTSINNPDFVDARKQNADFVGWISDNELEYKIGAELKKKTFSNFSIAGIYVDIEIADTDEKRELGLSGRESIVSNAGLLFVFQKLQPAGIWMKDMKFPIDIVWIDDSLRVIYIKKDAKPESFPEIFLPPQNALYVLELNSGFVEKNKIKIGDSIVL
jgi:uncharacterized membrane protein (UPF0127 family)